LIALLIALLRNRFELVGEVATFGVIPLVDFGSAAFE
jgi:hypothetical protein